MCASITESRTANSINLDMYADYTTGPFPIDLCYGDTVVKTCHVTSNEIDAKEKASVAN